MPLGFGLSLWSTSTLEGRGALAFAELLDCPKTTRPQLMASHLCLLVLWHKLGFPPIAMDEFRSVYNIKQVEKGSGWFYTSCPKTGHIVLGLPLSTKMEADLLLS